MSVAESMGKICTFCSVYVWKFRRAVTSSWTKARAWPARSRSFSWKDIYKMTVFDMDLFKYEKKTCLDTKNHYQQFLSPCYFSLKYTTAIILNLIFIHKLQKGTLFSDNKVSFYFTQLVMVCLCCIFQTRKPQKH